MAQQLHNFFTSLERDEQFSRSFPWEQIYKTRFPDIVTLVDTWDSETYQRQGVDRIAYLSDGTVLLFDEKIRHKSYGDILLEYWSNQEAKEPGWIEKDSPIDYLAYAFVNQEVYFFPWADLKKVWEAKKAEWKRRFFNPRAYNRGKTGNRYTTVSVAVPKGILLKEVILARFGMYPYGELTGEESPSSPEE